MRTLEEISDRTGFDAGDWFESVGELRDYFDWLKGQIDPYTGGLQFDPDELDEACQVVIDNGWHMMVVGEGERDA